MAAASHSKMRSCIAAPQTLGFLLLDNFTLISLASATGPLRMANQLTGRKLYRWYTLSLDGAPVRASDGLQVTPDLALSTPSRLDTVIVCGGVAHQRSIKPEHVAWLQTQARRSRRLGAVCTGSWALAQAGLLDGYEVSTHWESLTAMQEAFPKVVLTHRLFSIDRDRVTSSGGTAPLDMMLTLIGRDHGRELAAAISEMFIYERMRGELDQQRIPLRHVLGTTQPKLIEAVALMEANLEEPISLDELASYVRVSRRQLERLFQNNLSCTPSRYYLKLRLTRARQLLKQTPMSIIEVAMVCGFVSTPHFSKCYREHFGIPPSNERLWHALDRGPVKTEKEVLKALKTSTFVPLLAEPESAATRALSQAEGESTYGSVRLDS